MIEDKVHLYWCSQRHCVRSNCTWAKQCTSAQSNSVLVSYTNLTYIYHNHKNVYPPCFSQRTEEGVVCDCWRVPAPWEYWSRQSIIVLFWYRMVEMDVYIDPRLVWGRECKEVKVQPLSYQVRYQERCKENIWHDKSLVFLIFRYNWTETAAFKQNELAIWRILILS